MAIKPNFGEVSNLAEVQEVGSNSSYQSLTTFTKPIKYSKRITTISYL